jgi:hypothetical protein
LTEGGVTVGTVIRESVRKTLEFVAWYLEARAERIVLYFDDPNDPSIPLLADQPRVQAIACTPEFWASLRISSAVRFTKRQNAALTHGYRNAATDWYLAVDGDEFVYLPDNDLDRFAQSIDPEVRAVRFATAEAIGRISDDEYFRVPASGAVLRKIYGNEAAWLLRGRAGLAGHAIGKSMTRTGLAIMGLRQHFATDKAGKPISDLVIGPSAEGALLHYFATSFENWREKVTWRRQAWGFDPRVAGKIDISLEADPDAGLRKIYDQMHVVTDDGLRAMQAAGAALVLQVDRAAVARSRFPLLHGEPGGPSAGTAGQGG